ILFPSIYGASTENEQLIRPPFVALRPEANPQHNPLQIIRTELVALMGLELPPQAIDIPNPLNFLLSFSKLAVRENLYCRFQLVKLVNRS
ncbi:hypothetical protein, partial [Vibrio intestinalis]|uniref:hypothetical protein n=1 Tax=Vibrio intestinalis TaxID=2933291 RepID=UPI0021A317AB